MWEHITRDPNLVWGLGQFAGGTGWWEEVKCSLWTRICSWTLGNEKLSRKGSRYRDCKAAAQHVQRPRGTNLWEELKEGKCGQSLMQTDSEGGIGGGSQGLSMVGIGPWEALCSSSQWKATAWFSKGRSMKKCALANPSQLCGEWIWRVS